MRLVLAVTAAVVAFALAAVPARADGDPASDVLPAQNVFFPYNPSVSPGLQRRVVAEAAAAARAGFPVRVALIASPLDLGAVSSLFGRPQRYAAFLEQEIGRPLLVVMPNGYGVEGLGRAATAAARSLAVPSGSRPDDLARGASSALAALAAAAGHRLVSPGRGSSRGGGWGGGSDQLVLGAAVWLIIAVALTAAARRELRAAGRDSQSTGVVGAGPAMVRAAALQPLLVIGLGLMLGGLAWAMVRGISYYGLAPMHVGYDLDQPPFLLVAVGAWLWYRSRRR